VEEPGGVYGRLLKQIDGLPRTEREVDKDFQRKLKEIVIALNGIENQLNQTASGYSNEEYLNGLQKQLNRQRLTLMEIQVGFHTLWEWHKTHSSGFFYGFKNALIEVGKLAEILNRTLKERKKRLR